MCAAFLQYFTSVPVQEELVKTTAISIPSNGGATSAITDPTLQKVLTYLQGVSYNQLYFDQALPTNVGNAVNDAVSNFFAGQGTAQDIADSAGKAATPVTATIRLHGVQRSGIQLIGEGSSW